MLCLKLRPWEYFTLTSYPNLSVQQLIFCFKRVTCNRLFATFNLLTKLTEARESTNLNRLNRPGTSSGVVELPADRLRASIAHTYSLPPVLRSAYKEMNHKSEYSGEIPVMYRDSEYTAESSNDSYHSLNLVTETSDQTNSDYAYFDADAQQYRFMFVDDAVKPTVNDRAAPKNHVVATNSDYAYVDSQYQLKPKYNMVADIHQQTIGTPSDPWILRPHRSSSPLPGAKKYNYVPFGEQPALSRAGSDTNTHFQNELIPNVFDNEEFDTNAMRTPTAPATMTLSKLVRDIESQVELAGLNVFFENKAPIEVEELKMNVGNAASDETMNKRYLTQESIYELQQLPSINSLSEFGEQVLRDFSLQSLEDVRAIPSLSGIKLNNEEARDDISDDVMSYYAECMTRV